MNRRTKSALAIGSALVLSLSLFAVGSVAKSKIQRLGTSTQVETSTKGNKRTLTVTGVLQSSSQLSIVASLSAQKPSPQ